MAFFSPNTLGSLYNAKDPLPRGSVTHAVYSVKCKTCDDEYVGETRRAVDVSAKNTVPQLDWGSARSQPLPSMSMISSLRMRWTGLVCVS